MERQHIQPYWNRITIDSNGQIQTLADTEPDARQKFIDDFREFIQPNHIYLDVTTASRKDVSAIWGRRISRSDAIKSIPSTAKWRAREILTGPSALLTAWKGYEFPPPRNGSNYTERELVSHITRTLKRRLKSGNPRQFVPMPNAARTVAEYQDELNWVRWIPDPKRAGRAKGELRPPMPWLGTSTFRDVEDELRAHPDKYGGMKLQFQDQAVEKEKANRTSAGTQRTNLTNFNSKFLPQRGQLAPGEERKIRTRAGRNFDKRLGHLRSHR